MRPLSTDCRRRLDFLRTPTPMLPMPPPWLGPLPVMLVVTLLNVEALVAASAPLEEDGVVRRGPESKGRQHSVFELLEKRPPTVRLPGAEPRGVRHFGDRDERRENARSLLSGDRNHQWGDMRCRLCASLERGGIRVHVAEGYVEIVIIGLRADPVVAVNRRGVARRGGHRRIADDGDVARDIRREPGRRWSDDGEECSLFEDIGRQNPGESGGRVGSGMPSPASAGWCAHGHCPWRQARPPHGQALPDRDDYR